MWNLGDISICSYKHILSLSVNRLDYINMKSIAAITILASSAAAFAPAPVSKVESSLNYAAELDNMIGVTPETGNKVVSDTFHLV